MCKAFPCSDYYGNSVAMPDFQGQIPIAFRRSGLGNPRLFFDNKALMDCRIRLSSFSAYRSCAVAYSCLLPSKVRIKCYSVTFSYVITFRHSSEKCRLDYRSINQDFILISIFHLPIQSQTGNCLTYRFADMLHSLSGFPFR